MAEEKVASLGNEASHSKKNVAKKMQEVNTELIVHKTLVPIPGSPSNFILGPCFKTTFPVELSPVYPLAEGEKLLLHVQPDLFGGTYRYSSPSITRRWIDWVNRVEKAKGEVWKSADIYNAIQLSKNNIPVDENFLYAALCYWSISTNSFHFRCGMMGPTVLDIVALTGLRPHGEEVSAILGMAGSTCQFPQYGAIYDDSLGYSKYLDVSKEDTAVTEEEHVAFLFTWLSKHLLCDSSPSVNMIKQCTKLAFALAAGRKLALAPFLLSNLYHGCADIIMDRFHYERGPFWILQFWLQSYFPEFRPVTLDNCDFPTYGYPLAEGVLIYKSFEEYFLFFHNCASRSVSQFTPFSSRKFGPVWFKKSLDPNFQKLSNSELQDIWDSYLIARDLPYSILLDESSKCKYEVEHYSPNQFARQFGMTQAVPFHQSANKLPTRRKDLLSVDYTEETESRFCQLKRKFLFFPFHTNPSSTEFFDSWWSTYINNRDKTAIDVLGKILPQVIPLSPVRQQVAAPRSNSIKGNSQSAGTSVQNMKRKHEGESIPSQSLAQQEEPTRILFKKVKTYSRKMPLEGTTSTVPRSSTPANEDRTKADNQVASDDTPISTSDKDGLEGTVSPSAEMLATAKGDVERLLIMPSQDLLLPENCSALSAALSIYAAAPDLSAERALVLEKLKENLPHLSSTSHRAKKDQNEYYKKSAKKIILVDKLTKDQELYTALKDGDDKLEYKISKWEAKLKHAKSRREAIQKAKLNLEKRCFQKSSALDEMEAGFTVLKEMKVLADSDIARVEESLRDFKSKIIE